MPDRPADAVPHRPDPLGLRRAFGDWLLPTLVASMAFLAALALGAAIATEGWVESWRLGAGAALTAQVPRPNDPVAPQQAPGQVGSENLRTRLERSLEVLRASPAVASARQLSDAELDALLASWVGDRAGVQGWLPAVIAVRAAADPAEREQELAGLAESLEAAVPGASLESHGAWVGRLARLIRGLQACAWGALVLVATVATLVVAAATRAGLVARRVSLVILHGLGATDGYIAMGFAGRATALAAVGGAAGALVALPVLLRLSGLARPLAATTTLPALETATGLPASLWLGLALLPVTAAAIGYATAQATVRVWLRRLP